MTSGLTGLLPTSSPWSPQTLLGVWSVSPPLFPAHHNLAPSHPFLTGPPPYSRPLNFSFHCNLPAPSCKQAQRNPGRPGTQTQGPPDLPSVHGAVTLGHGDSAAGYRVCMPCTSVGHASFHEVPAQQSSVEGAPCCGERELPIPEDTLELVGETFSDRLQAPLPRPAQPPADLLRQQRPVVLTRTPRSVSGEYHVVLGGARATLHPHPERVGEGRPQGTLAASQATPSLRPGSRSAGPHPHPSSRQIMKI